MGISSSLRKDVSFTKQLPIDSPQKPSQFFTISKSDSIKEKSSNVRPIALSFREKANKKIKERFCEFQKNDKERIKPNSRQKFNPRCPQKVLGKTSGDTQPLSNMEEERNLNRTAALQINSETSPAIENYSRMEQRFNDLSLSYIPRFPSDNDSNYFSLEAVLGINFIIKSLERERAKVFSNPEEYKNNERLFRLLTLRNLLFLTRNVPYFAKAKGVSQEVNQKLSRFRANLKLKEK